MRTGRRFLHQFDQQDLARDPDHAKLGGVCAGIARYLNISRFIVRLGAVIALCLMPQLTLIAYGLAYLVLDDA